MSPSINALLRCCLFYALAISPAFADSDDAKAIPSSGTVQIALKNLINLCALM